MSNVTESQYSLGYNGSYATVECLIAKNLEFQNVVGGAGFTKGFFTAFENGEKHAKQLLRTEYYLLCPV